YLHVVLPSKLASDASLVGRAGLPAGKHVELTFARQIRGVASGKPGPLPDGVAWQRVKIADQAAAVIRMARAESWFVELEQHAISSAVEHFMLPPIMAQWFDEYRKFATLGELGVEVAQGLRTGA